MNMEIGERSEGKKKGLPVNFTNTEEQNNNNHNRTRFPNSWSWIRHGIYVWTNTLCPGPSQTFLGFQIQTCFFFLLLFSTHLLQNNNKKIFFSLALTSKFTYLFLQMFNKKNLTKLRCPLGSQLFINHRWILEYKNIL